MITKKIKKYLSSKMIIKYFQINDDSLLHNPNSTEMTHLKIIMVSDDFNNKKLILRHRIILKYLKNIIKKQIYSIALYTYTSIEWKNIRHQNISSTPCLQKNILLRKNNHQK